MGTDTINATSHMSYKESEMVTVPIFSDFFQYFKTLDIRYSAMCSSHYALLSYFLSWIHSEFAFTIKFNFYTFAGLG